MIQRPRRNRVTPFGDIVATMHRGTLMGNRGDLHAPDGTVCRPWKLQRWISCTLLHSPAGHRVTFDTPGCYTPLFFADEVTALAAGHRPCASCRRPAYDAFRDGWQVAFGNKPSAVEMDDILHDARIDARGHKRTFVAPLGEVPDGVFVVGERSPTTAFLVRAGGLYPWSHAGYGKPVYDVSRHRPVSVITPAPIVGILKARPINCLTP
ncbi:hypothetical protein [Sinorhizobium meliloti]|uniref:hypothetical protein n=1 Tax=Rhizobium meliloti TaxID=382 RepID=UPI0012961B79|nr:hypothetical protein [Sinorhizobium meliloti]MQX74643.1 hypothetical protein [Sinorhizobium meliloti]